MYTKIEYSGVLEILDLTEDDFYSVAHREEDARFNINRFRRSLEKHRFSGEKWWGVASLDKFKELVENGWEEGAKKVKEVEKSLPEIPILKAMRPTLVRREYGDVIDMQSVYMGDLDHAWEGLHRGTRRADLRYTIYASIGNNHTVHGNDFFYPMALAISWANRLISAGQTVRIVALINTVGLFANDRSGVTDTLITLKGWGDPLLPDILSIFALGGAFRYIGFKAKSCTPYQIANNYGYSDFNRYDSLKQSIPINERYFIIPTSLSQRNINSVNNDILAKIREDIAC